MMLPLLLAILVATATGTVTSIVVNRHGRHQKQVENTNAHRSFVRRDRDPKIAPGTEFPEYKGQKVQQNAQSIDIEKKAMPLVTAAKIKEELNTLIEEGPRSFLSDSGKVQDYLKRQLEGAHYTTCFHTFTDHPKDKGLDTGPFEFKNVVGFLQGTGKDIVVLGAHYDARPYTGKAPGAEDNGSGVAATLAIARALAGAAKPERKVESTTEVLLATEEQPKPTSSVYIVFFAGEEPGLIGSEHFATALLGQSGGEHKVNLLKKDDAGIPPECSLKHLAPSSLNEASLLTDSVSEAQRNIHAFVMDEVGWRSPSEKEPTLQLETYDTKLKTVEKPFGKMTEELMNEITSANARNEIGLRITHSNHPFGSDHMSFLSKHIPALLTINGDDTAFKHYHQSSDTIDNVDFDYLEKITKVNLGALINLAYKPV